jgi:hypothetical protein
VALAGALCKHQYGAVLCRGVVMYLDDPRPLVDALCAPAAPGEIVSIVAKKHGGPGRHITAFPPVVLLTRAGHSLGGRR